MIILLAIGENTPVVNLQWARCIKHLDVAEVIPRRPGRDEDDVSVQCQKDFLCLKVNSSGITDSQFKDLRNLLIEPRTSGLEVTERRKWALDISRANLTTAQKNKLLQLADDSRNRIKYTAQEINAVTLGVTIPFNTFKSLILNKDTGQYLSEVI